MTETRERRIINEASSTDYEDVSLGDQGYSACCNEVVIWGGDCADGHCQHDGWGE